MTPATDAEKAAVLHNVVLSKPGALARPKRHRRTAMEHFAGLDVGTKASSLCVVDQDGTIVFEADIPTDPDLVARALKP